MPKIITDSNSSETLITLMQKLLIIELAKAKVPQNDIKKIVGVSTNTVNSIVKLMKNKEK